MGRYLGPSCKLCRREGVKLMIKGVRCMSEKCALNKKRHPQEKFPSKKEQNFRVWNPTERKTKSKKNVLPFRKTILYIL